MEDLHSREHLRTSGFERELDDFAFEVTKDAILEGALSSDTDWLVEQLNDWDGYLDKVHTSLAKNNIPIDDRQRMLDAYNKEVFQKVLEMRRGID